jgi:ubiquinone/menaquinone biosynthesis C-methylase UbiE
MAPDLEPPPAQAYGAALMSPRVPPRTLPDLRRRREADELLDRGGHDPALLAANLADIRRVNRLAGGTRVILRCLPALLEAIPAGERVSLLDLGTGSADVPVAVADWLRRRGQACRIVASDLSDEVLAVAVANVGDRPEIELARLDALATGLPDGAFDVVLCSLMLHHLDPPEGVRLLREMARVGRVGFVLNDVARGWAGYAVAWAASRVATRNPMTRHDMPLSVERAYTPDELRSMLAAAGVLGRTRVSTHPLFRMAAVYRTEAVVERR